MKQELPWLPRIRSRLLREAIYWVPLTVFLVVVTYVLADDGKNSPSILGPYTTGVVTSRVEGVDGPAVRLGDAVNFEVEICTSGTADVNTDLFIRRITNGGVHEPEKMLSFSTTRQPQCTTINLSILIPMRIGTGRFSFFGSDLVVATGEQRVWTTETFTVVP